MTKRIGQRDSRDGFVKEGISTGVTGCSVHAARMAFYTLPRGKSSVTGPSIRLAEEIARVYGNFQYGHRELSRDDKKSEVEVYAWDMEKPVAVGDRVYCTQKCLDAERQEMAEEKAKRDAAIKAAKDAFPGVSVLWVGTRHGVDGMCVTFVFPGGLRPADWVVGEETVLINAFDVEAWKAFKANIAMAAIG